MKEYENEDLIVHWYPELCSHPGICLRTLPEVFDVHRRPWVNINGAEPIEIIKAVDLCPSGALRYSLPEGSRIRSEEACGPGRLDLQPPSAAVITIKPIPNGPLIIDGPAAIIDTSGNTTFEAQKMVLCSCGCSCNKPFCDGSHMKNKP
ncbi:MAG: hypothetical protein H6Q60_720 [Oscillospiraceae bacterium]|nr:hypothetical protein [Oscillospiraceae bacterium]